MLHSVQLGKVHWSNRHMDETYQQRLIAVEGLSLTVCLMHLPPQSTGDRETEELKLEDQ